MSPNISARGVMLHMPSGSTATATSRVTMVLSATRRAVMMARSPAEAAHLMVSRLVRWPGGTGPRGDLAGGEGAGEEHEGGELFVMGDGLRGRGGDGGEVDFGGEPCESVGEEGEGEEEEDGADDVGVGVLDGRGHRTYEDVDEDAGGEDAEDDGGDGVPQEHGYSLRMDELISLSRLLMASLLSVMRVQRRQRTHQMRFRE